MSRIVEKAEELGYEVLIDVHNEEVIPLHKKSNYNCDAYIKIIGNKIVDYYVIPHNRKIKHPVEAQGFTNAIFSLQQEVKDLEQYEEESQT